MLFHERDKISGKSMKGIERGERKGGGQTEQEGEGLGVFMKRL